MRLSELIGGRFGMLADGPEQLVLAYEDVMRKSGFDTSHHATITSQEPEQGVIILNNSYVIASAFEASII